MRNRLVQTGRAMIRIGTLFTLIVAITFNVLASPGALVCGQPKASLGPAKIFSDQALAAQALGFPARDFFKPHWSRLYKTYSDYGDGIKALRIVSEKVAYYWILQQMSDVAIGKPGAFPSANAPFRARKLVARHFDTVQEVVFRVGVFLIAAGWGLAHGWSLLAAGLFANTFQAIGFAIAHRDHSGGLGLANRFMAGFYLGLLWWSPLFYRRAIRLHHLNNRLWELRKNREDAASSWLLTSDERALYDNRNAIERQLVVGAYAWSDGPRNPTPEEIDEFSQVVLFAREAKQNIHQAISDWRNPDWHTSAWFATCGVMIQKAMKRRRAELKRVYESVTKVEHMDGRLFDLKFINSTADDFFRFLTEQEIRLVPSILDVLELKKLLNRSLRAAKKRKPGLIDEETSSAVVDKMIAYTGRKKGPAWMYLMNALLKREIQREATASEVATSDQISLMLLRYRLQKWLQKSPLPPQNADALRAMARQIAAEDVADRSSATDDLLEGVLPPDQLYLRRTFSPLLPGSRSVNAFYRVGRSTTHLFLEIRADANVALSERLSFVTRDGRHWHPVGITTVGDLHIRWMEFELETNGPHTARQRGPRNSIPFRAASLSRAA